MRPRGHASRADPQTTIWRTGQDGSRQDAGSFTDPLRRQCATASKPVYGARRVRRQAICLFGATLLAAGCYPTAPDGRVKACDLRFQPTRPVVTGTSVLGQLAVVCDTQPERHNLTMWLDHRARTRGATWNARSDLFSDHIPDKTKTIHQLLAPCEPGVWRVRAHVTGTLAGTPFDFTDKSVERIVGEHECK